MDSTRVRRLYSYIFIEKLSTQKTFLTLKNLCYKKWGKLLMKNTSKFRFFAVKLNILHL